MENFLSNREYYNFLNQLVEHYPHYFSKASYVKHIEATMSNTIFDPFRKNPPSRENFSTQETVFLIKRSPFGEEVLTVFNDLGEKNIGSLFFNTDSQAKLYNKFTQSNSVDTTVGTLLWFYLWGQILNIDLNIEQHLEGLHSIVATKTDDAKKVEMMSRHIFDRKKYEKFVALNKNQWDTVFTVKHKQNNLTPPSAHLFLNETHQSEDNFVKYKDTVNFVKNVTPVSDTCHECSLTTSQTKILPSLHGDYYYFLCEECLIIKKEQYSKTIDYYLEQNDEEVVARLASNAHLDEKHLKILSFHDNKHVRERILSNPNITDDVKTVIVLQK